MSLENYDFILATSKHIRNRKREKIASNEERLKKIDTVRKLSLERLKVESRHKKKVLNYIQEVDPPYLK